MSYHFNSIYAVYIIYNITISSIWLNNDLILLKIHKIIHKVQHLSAIQSYLRKWVVRR